MCTGERMPGRRPRIDNPRDVTHVAELERNRVAQRNLRLRKFVDGQHKRLRRLVSAEQFGVLCANRKRNDEAWRGR
ncbi:hypothetical protein GCM10011399_18310 [Subtercola lobariae]|uniref:Uncharacterized protein n=1 Tax=Subtercola lobariae TaxID=1588641 RepID=A0A917EX80_9MICO|nr:hypothetical protein GCM10011399_18310 [Subtercola lobariae]